MTSQSSDYCYSTASSEMMNDLRSDGASSSRTHPPSILTLEPPVLIQPPEMTTFHSLFMGRHKISESVKRGGHWRNCFDKQDTCSSPLMEQFTSHDVRLTTTTAVSEQVFSRHCPTQQQSSKPLLLSSLSPSPPLSSTTLSDSPSSSAEVNQSNQPNYGTQSTLVTTQEYEHAEIHGLSHGHERTQAATTTTINQHSSNKSVHTHGGDHTSAVSHHHTHRAAHPHYHLSSDEEEEEGEPGGVKQHHLPKRQLHSNMAAKTDGNHPSGIMKSNRQRNHRDRRYNHGRWSATEHEAFVHAFKVCGRDWSRIAREFVRTRMRSQVASHAQKYLMKMEGGIVSQWDSEDSP